MFELRSGRLVYGHLNATTTIALFGDSHAAFWFPAMEGLAERQGWRLLNLTMSSCTPADLSVYNSIFKRIYTECPTWRQQALARLVATRPSVIVVTGTHGISPVDSAGSLLTGDALTTAWQAGMARTLERLIPAAGRVILLADTPTSQFDPPVRRDCLPWCGRSAADRGCHRDRCGPSAGSRGEARLSAAPSPGAYRARWQPA